MIDKEKLKELALAAKSDDWSRDKYGSVVGSDGSDIKFRSLSITCAGGGIAQAEANTNWLAAANPAAILELLAELETAKTAINALTNIISDRSLATTSIEPAAATDSSDAASDVLPPMRGTDSLVIADDSVLRDAVWRGLKGLYYCGRVWDAWQVGTMSQDDFTPAEDSDECIDGVVDEIRAAASASPVPRAQGGNTCDLTDYSTPTSYSNGVAASPAAAVAAPATEFVILPRVLTEKMRDTLEFGKSQRVESTWLNLVANAEVAAAAPAVPVPAEPQWISVEDRLPPENEFVVVLYWPYNNRENKQIAGWATCIKGTFYDHDGEEHHDPSHWMLVPAAPSLQQPKQGSQP